MPDNIPNYLTSKSIFLEGISVVYRAPTERITTIKEYAIRILQGKVKKQIFNALTNVSLEVERGQIFGIVGRNGAGKSTLLKVISRVLIPTDGRVWIRGSVAPLLQLGAGFHPELTGRENVFLNGTILGHRHGDIEEKMEYVTKFSEIGDFLEAPVRTYSSGMYARLGFAVATAWRPDILVIDEVLGVGDATFQEKCYRRIKDFCEEGTTVLLVSHTASVVRDLCKSAAWLDRGHLVAVGNAQQISDRYKNNLQDLK
jgi:ABC-2 type transport system ATP-binding protein/lipopolysaccharide transport system ATP-binding protein